MQTDALDRFGTRLERYTKFETKMMETAGLERSFSDNVLLGCNWI